MAGRDDFTGDEWTTLRQAMMAAGVLVAWAEGGGADIGKEMFMLNQALRRASQLHPSQLIRELTDVQRFQTGFDQDQRVGENEAPRLETIQVATRIVAGKAPADTEAFRAFLVELAEVVANANVESRSKGPVSVKEAAAIERVRQAAGLR